MPGWMASWPPVSSSVLLQHSNSWEQQISFLQWIMKARLKKVKTSFLSRAINEPRLFCRRNTALPAWLAPTLLQAALEWQSDPCICRKWGVPEKCSALTGLAFWRS